MDEKRQQIERSKPQKKTENKRMENTLNGTDN